LTATSGTENFPTFSPDGDQIAFAWNGEKADNWDIYVKVIGPAESHRLTTDPEIDSFPAWSPNGRQIAFVHVSRGSDTGRVHVVSSLGGSDRRLSDEPVALGRLSWSPDGRWLVTGAHRFANDIRTDIRGIRLIDASSGETRAISSPSGPTYHTQPAFSNDGRHLAYVSCVSTFSCEVDVVELGAGPMPTGTARRLTPKVTWPRGLAWSRDGTSVIYADWLSRGRLWRVGIQGDAPPERIETASFHAYWPTAAVSRDRLAFARAGTTNDICRFEPGRPPEALAASSFEDSSPDLSPDGRRFAFASARGGEGDEIWLATADGRNPTQLTHGPGLVQGSPRWSPDGRRIAFDSFGEDGHFDIWAIDAEGGPPHRLTSNPADDNMPTWSHDGRLVYFSSNRTGAWTIWRVPALGGSEEQVTSAGGGRSQEAPDGKTLFVQSSLRSASPLLAVPLAGGPERTVIDCVRNLGYSIGAAGIYYLSCGGDPLAVPLSLLDPRTGRERPLGELERPGGGLTVSLDGKTILFTKGWVQEGNDLVLIENFR
jgi:Tol biopolymer transport system component